eukprot:jgi/Bigna1/129964/aug1.10_g4672
MLRSSDANKPNTNSSMPMHQSNAARCRLDEKDGKRMQRLTWPNRLKQNGGLHLYEDSTRKPGCFAVAAFVGGKSFKIFEVYTNEKEATDAAVELMCKPTNEEECLFQKAYDLCVIDLRHASFIAVPGPDENIRAKKILHSDSMMQQIFDHHIEATNGKIDKVTARAVEEFKTKARSDSKQRIESKIKSIEDDLKQQSFSGFANKPPNNISSNDIEVLASAS